MKDWSTPDPQTGLAPKDADLDDDGEISILDYTILSPNFGKDGEGY
jgi:hypothetical protein